MNKDILRTTLLLTSLLVLWVGSAYATDISGAITTTLVITNDSQLVGNVDCTGVTPTGTPCIQFGAGGISLQLNGFTMTGRADPTFGCTPFVNPLTPRESGIDTNGQSSVEIEGHGLVRRFRDHGIFVNGGSGIQVEKVTLSTNCHNGIQLSASNSEVQENVAVRNSTVATVPCGGIEVAGNNNVVEHNETGGNGLVFDGIFSVFGFAGPVDFGIAISSGTGNLIEGNGATGNQNGITVFPAASGNVISQNLFAGNPNIQTSKTFGAVGFDIRNLSAAGANTFTDNLCETSSGPDVSCPNLPEFAGHENP